MKPHADPKVDYAFKHVFGREQSKPALISLVDAVLNPVSGQGIVSLELMNPFNEKEALDDKLSVLDIKIKARDNSGRQFNIEMQMLALGAFRARALYYWARLYQSQLQEGDDYRDLRPTIAICFVDTPLFAGLPDYHLLFELRERHHRALFTDQLQLHILELPKFRKAVEELATPLDRWLFFLRHAQHLDLDALPETLNVAEVRWALGDLIMIAQSEQERERYEARRKMQRDVYTELAKARDEGRAEGRQEGLAEAQISRIQSYQRLLGFEVSTVAQLRALSPDESENLAAGLEADLRAKLPNRT